MSAGVAAPASRLLTATFTGGPYQRGLRHGELFGEMIRQSGILDFYLSYCERQLLASPSRVAELSFRMLHMLVSRRHSDEARALMQGFSRSSGIALSAVARGLVMPDVLNFLAGVHGRGNALGCTSIAAWGAYTENGLMIYARNLDFAGNGTFDRHPLIARNHPDKGIPYVSFGTAGGVIDGITGINEEGLSVAIHQHISTDIGLLSDGRPILDLGRHILQNCRTIDEAAEEAGKWRTTSGWSLNLTHWKQRRAAALERAARRFAVVRYEDGMMVRTNTYLDATLHRDEIDYPGFRESSRMRAKRAEAVLTEGKGRIDVAGLANLLGDHRDSDRGLLRAYCGVIAQPHSVCSIVIEPERGWAWVSEGEAPACEGPFRKIALWEDSEPGETLAGVASELTGDRREASRAYLRAGAAWGERDLSRAYSELETAVAKDPEDPIYRYMLGVLALKCGVPARAEESLAAGAELPDIAHRGTAQQLWRARTLELMGRRRDALPLYEKLLADPHAHRNLKAACEAGRARPYSADRVESVVCDFIFGDTFSY